MTTISITQYDPLKAEIEAVKAENASLVFAYDTPKGNKEARSHIARMRTKKADIERVRKAAKADALEYGRKVDDIAKMLTGELEGMIAVHQKPLDEIEARAAAIEAEKLRKAEEERLEAERLEAEYREYELSKARAAEAKAKAELEAAQRKQREEQIAREAEERARLAAEFLVRHAQEQKLQAEQQKLASERAAFEAAQKAEQDRVAAAEKAKADQEAAVKAAVEAQAKREQEAKDAAERKRVEDEAKHNQWLKERDVRAKIIKTLAAQIHELIASVCGERSASNSIAEAILDGRIKGVKYVG